MNNFVLDRETGSYEFPCSVCSNRNDHAPCGECMTCVFNGLPPDELLRTASDVEAALQSYPNVYEE